MNKKYKLLGKKNSMLIGNKIELCKHSLDDTVFQIKYGAGDRVIIKFKEENYIVLNKKDAIEVSRRVRNIIDKGYADRLTMFFQEDRNCVPGVKFNLFFEYEIRDEDFISIPEVTRNKKGYCVSNYFIDENTGERFFSSNNSVYEDSPENTARVEQFYKLNEEHDSILKKIMSLLDETLLFNDLRNEYTENKYEKYTGKDVVCLEDLFVYYV